MAEYNVQINKYNANNLGYDQLYPQPMKHADTHLLNGSDPINIGELGVSNRNLLDNAYFANPDAIIDQRGGYVVPPGTTYYNLGNLAISIGKLPSYATVIRYATYDGVAYPVVKVDGKEYMTRNGTAVRGYVGAGYTIDRFRLGTDGGALLLCDGYIRIVKTGSWINLEQIVDNFSALKGKKLTVSVLVDGNLNLIISIGGNRYPFAFYHRGGKGVVSGTFVLPDDATAFSVIFQAVDNSGVNLYAAKLELGTVQTLAHQDADGNWALNEIPDYGEQLRLCQRYFWKSWTGDRNAQKSILGRVFTNSNRITGFDYPVEMRTRPSITVYGLTGADKVTKWDNDVDYGPASVAYWDTQRCVALACDGAGLSNGDYVYYFVEANADL